MFTPGNILYFTPFYFSNGNAKNKIISDDGLFGFPLDTYLYGEQTDIVVAGAVAHVKGYLIFAMPVLFIIRSVICLRCVFCYDRL